MESVLCWLSCGLCSWKWREEGKFLIVFLEEWRQKILSWIVGQCKQHCSCPVHSLLDFCGAKIQSLNFLTSPVGPKINHGNVGTNPVGPIINDFSGKHAIYLWFSFTINENWNNLQTRTKSKSKLWEIENEEDTVRFLITLDQYIDIQSKPYSWDPPLHWTKHGFFPDWSRGAIVYAGSGSLMLTTCISFLFLSHSQVNYD